MMAAQAKSVPVKKRTIRQATQIRTTLASPYAFQTHWIKLPHNVELEILNSLASIFEELPPYSVHKEPGKTSSNWEKSQLKNAGKRDPGAVKAMRSIILTGINQVTKGLERGHIAAVVLRKPSVPGESVLTDHLKVLSGMKEVPVCVVSGLGDRLCPLINMKQLSIIGFKKKTSCPEGLPPQAYQKLSRLIQRIEEVTPIVVLPWKHTHTDLMDKTHELIKRFFPNGSQRVTQMEAESKGIGQKRKAEEPPNPNKKAKVDNTLQSPFPTGKADPPGSGARVGVAILESPFSQERTQMGVSKGKQTGAIAVGSSFRYQTAKVLHILKGDKKSGKKKKKSERRKFKK